ncbi:hypothetical protein Q8A64_05710 [Oxalobacteraceae bacterium R-40]|uniref:Uncharacterized protein n=1 Tax=Keguizhuia sedimenti TaxID=3064264 RepID=A0ABU1BLN0_9BURK|nr:hypothetical protein [Oxalobacteraceae bacterium R-40]
MDAQLNGSRRAIEKFTPGGFMNDFLVGQISAQQDFLCLFWRIEMLMESSGRNKGKEFFFLYFNGKP